MNMDLENQNTINQINDVLKNIEANLKNVQDEAQKREVSQKAYDDELAKLGKEQLKLAEQLAEVQQKSQALDTPSSKANSIGDLIANQKSVLELKRGSNFNISFEVDTKDVMTSTPANTFTRDTFLAPYERAGIIAAYDKPLMIEDLFPHVPIDTDTVMYLREGEAGTNAAAARKEGAKFTESKYNAPKFDRAVMQNIGHYAVVTEELLSNAAAYSAYINQKMIYGLNAVVEAQLLSGDGSATAIKGILQSGNYTDKKDDAKTLLATEHSSDCNLFDFVNALKTIYETNNYFSPTTLVLTPQDWARLQLLKDSKGLYILGGPQSLASQTLWGMRVVTCANSKLQGKYLLLNPTLSATIWDRQALQVNMSNMDGENFKSKLVTIRMDRTLGLSVDRPNAIYHGDFAVPSFV